jgi:hypothetical protein
MGDDAPLTVVEDPDYNAAFDRLQRLKEDHWRHMREAWIGALAMGFTNDELCALSCLFSEMDTMDLRRVGLIGPGDGYDGTRAGRKKASDALVALQSKMVAQRAEAQRRKVKESLT